MNQKITTNKKGNENKTSFYDPWKEKGFKNQN